MKDIFAYRLKNARIRQGMSVKILTELLGVSKQMISKYESGQSMPDGSKLIALANALGVKPDYFFNPIQVSLEDVKFRKKSKTPQKKLDSIKVSILSKMENYLLVEDVLSIKSDFQNPLQENVVAEKNDVEDLAHQLRLNWNIGDNPIHSVIALLEEKGIKVVEIDEPLEHSFDGMATFVNDIFPVIVINKNYPIERKRFTLLHELGHLILNIDQKFSEKEEEKICDRFAGAILLPQEILFEEIGKKRKKINLAELVNIQKSFGISIPAIMYRLVGLHIINDSKIKSFYIKMNTQADFKQTVNMIRFPGDESSNRYESLVYRALSQEVISTSKASSFLEMDVKSLNDLLSLF